ncbi:MAG TPA: PAS domain S-box protein [Verrucomicrobiae bacterium]|nr:PAS domain S-box protein [Verrucomicrobiae bacterium]
MKILIVDDHPVNVGLLQTQLSAEGHEVISARDGIEALEQLVRERVDGIISDILMPRMDGYALCREVRRNADLRHLPFIFFSAVFNSEADEKLCFDVGGDKYLRKPATAGALVAALQDAMRQTRIAGRPPAPAADVEVMKEYRSSLVKKLAETNAELLASLDQLRLTEQRLNFALNLSHTGGWEMDLVDASTRRTPRHDEVFGYDAPLPSWSYERFVEHVLPEDRAAVDVKFNRAVDERVRLDFECRIRRTDGKVRWVRVAGEHQLDASGRSRSMAGIIQDISEWREAQQAVRDSERHYRELFDLALYAIVVGEPGGRYVDVNPAACTLTGYTREELLEMKFRLLAAPEEQAKVAAAVARMALGKVIREEWRARRKDGSLIIIEVSARQRDDGLIQAFIHDITARRQAEEILRKRADELETFHKLSVGRELQMIELKKEINALSRQAGQPEPYDLSFLRLER